jgi:hypothetical protein
MILHDELIQDFLKERSTNSQKFPAVLSI